MYLLGKHAKTESIITDENVQNILRKHLREMKDENRTPSNFCEDLNSFLLQSLPNSPPSVSVETARRWMIFLKFNATKASKGWFTDGHERVDVVQYRSIFLQKMESLERRMKRFGRIQLKTSYQYLSLEERRDLVSGSWTLTVVD